MSEFLIIGLIPLLVAVGWRIKTGKTYSQSPFIQGMIALHMVIYIAIFLHIAYQFILESLNTEWWIAANLNFAIFAALNLLAFIVVFSIEKGGD